MPGKRLVWQLYPSYLLVAVVALAVVGWFSSLRVRDFYIRHLSVDLETRAGLVRNQVGLEGKLLPAVQVDALCKKLGRQTDNRLTVMLASGQVIGDSDQSPAAMENHLTRDRPEIIAALDGRTGMGIRYSATLQRDMMYVAVPLKESGAITGVIRISLALTEIKAELRSIYLEIGAVLLIVAVVIAGISLLVSRKISRPLENLTRGAQLFAAGELGQRLAVSEVSEIGSLAESMNRMATELDNRIQAMTRQRNEQEAILASVVEGVLAVNTSEEVVNMNPACAELLGVDAQQTRGQTVGEVLRNPDLQEFVRRALESTEPVEGDVTLHEKGDQQLQVHGTVLRGADGGKLGAVVVLHDVTRLRRLETVRSDFVANVSHELRTPITPIKAAVEVLLDGSVKGQAKTNEFLSIIARQAGRLGAIINDLLNLSRIEEEEKQGIVLETSTVQPVLSAAVQSCLAKAKQKQIGITLRCHPGVEAGIAPPLLENAVVNLIDNAIKYSPNGSEVVVSTEGTPEGVTISVSDSGCGIERRHLPRLFERFYRVDKTRSQKLGGTGLGLAIVKHISKAHNGDVSVESRIGEGSVFSIHLPAPD